MKQRMLKIINFSDGYKVTTNAFSMLLTVCWNRLTVWWIRLTVWQNRLTVWWNRLTLTNGLLTQGTKLRLIQSPIRLKLSCWRPRFKSQSPSWRPELFEFALMFFATKWSFKVDESARTIRSVKENRHARMLWTEHVNIRHLGSSKCSVVYCEVKCPFWLRRHFSSKLGKPFHLTLLYNAFFQLSFFLIAPNFLALVTTLENLGARWLLGKKVNFVPCNGWLTMANG